MHHLARIAFSRVIFIEEKGICYTCGGRATGVGHLFHGVLDFFRLNNHLQCTPCNCGKGGQIKIYREKVIRLNGQQKFDEMRTKAMGEKAKGREYSDDYLKGVCKEYTGILEEIQ